VSGVMSEAVDLVGAGAGEGAGVSEWSWRRR
jgi:hypothetical protein